MTTLMIVAANAMNMFENGKIHAPTPELRYVSERAVTEFDALIEKHGAREEIFESIVAFAKLYAVACVAAFGGREAVEKLAQGAELNLEHWDGKVH